MKLREPLAGRARDAGPSAIADRDLMIAAIAVANRLIVVTSNVSEFARVPGVAVNDWNETQVTTRHHACFRWTCTCMHVRIGA